jgi:hypothetical protein
MPPIKHQQPGGHPAIISSDIQIPDDADLGTGSFTTKFKAGALPSSTVISSAMINAPSFQVSITINPNRDVPALLGTADGTDPKSRVYFLLPEHINPAVAHTLRIDFAKWHIFMALFDGMPLATKEPTTSH